MLGIELTLVPDARPAFSGGLIEGDAPPRLMARVVRPGRKGWVAGSLSWTKLDSQYGYDGWPAPQTQLLQEIYAIYRARSGQPFYYGYGYGDDKSIDLSAFESRQLWPLLDEAAALGPAAGPGPQSRPAGRIPRRGTLPGPDPRRGPFRAAGDRPAGPGGRPPGRRRRDLLYRHAGP